jgi:hypothetical protein
MKQRRRKTLSSLIVALAVVAIAAPVAQAGIQVRSERSQVARPASSFYSSQAYHALMVRSAAMNTWYSNLAKAQSALVAVRHADDRAGMRGPGITQTAEVVSSSGDGFDWGDASLGAGAALLAAAVLVGGIVLSRRRQTEPVAV